MFNLKNPYDAEKFKEYVNKLYVENKKSQYGIVVEVTKKQTQRTLAQNRYLHVCLGYFASEFGYTLEEVKVVYFKQMVNKDIFLRRRKNKRGHEVNFLRSTTDLDKSEMTAAIDRFRNWSSAECGLYIPAANESEALIAAEQQIEQFKEYL